VYGRLLGLVYVDGRLLQTWIVREGMSPYFTSYGCASGDVHGELLEAERDARQRGLGIWQPGHPIDYRVQIERWIRSMPCRPAM
jgi:endonuclease YncB( thermonuclease family)